ncbi:MAG: hypothetical protein ACETWQ_03275 [Phycisphaerae bacterium]
MKAGLWQEAEYIWPEPLRPDRDLTKVDKLVGLKNIQEVREFRRNFLSVIDRQLIELLNTGTAPKAAITTVVEEVKTNRLILGTECEAPAKLDALVREIDNSANGGQIDRDRIQSLVNQACRSEDRRKYLLRFLKEDPVNWEALKSTAVLLKNSRPELSDAIQWRHILARTLLRWHPDIYQAYLDTVATYTGEKYHYKPYIVGKPLRQAPPSNQEMLDFLSKRWNGSYVQNSTGPLTSEIETGSGGAFRTYDLPEQQCAGTSVFFPYGLAFTSTAWCRTESTFVNALFIRFGEECSNIAQEIICQEGESGARKPAFFR